MTSPGREGYSALQKIHITCRTCGITESFYSNLSVQHFKLSHRGHDVAGAAEVERQVEAPKPVPEQGAAPAPASREQEAVHVDTERGTKISRVVVDLLVFPALPKPVLRVQGFTQDGANAFEITSSPEGRAKVRDIISAGEYFDDGFSGVRYFWEPDVVEYSEESRESMGVPLRDAEPQEPLETRSARPQVQEEVDDSSVARTNEILFGVQRAGQEPAEDESHVFSPPTHALESEEVDVAETPLPPAVKQQEPVERRVEAPLPPKPASAKEVKPAAVARVDESEAAKEEERRDYLLVSKSWYIEGGAQNRKEAVRVSKVLKAFRWKVEPEYTIGVMLDDIMSIETAKGQISRDLVTRVEGAGYRLTAVTVDQGKPVAWFKRADHDAGVELEDKATGGAAAVSEAGPRADSEGSG